MKPADMIQEAWRRTQDPAVWTSPHLMPSLSPPQFSHIWGRKGLALGALIPDLPGASLLPTLGSGGYYATSIDKETKSQVVYCVA